MKLTNEQIEQVVKTLRFMANCDSDGTKTNKEDCVTWEAANLITEQHEETLSLRQEVERLRERLDKAHDLLMDSDYNPHFITAQFGEKEQDNG